MGLGDHEQATLRPDAANTEVALLREELAIKDARMARVPPRRRPHYGPVDRMRILPWKAARGWSVAQAAEVFAITEDTIALLSPQVLIERLIALVPRPRRHLVTYHGVLVPAAGLRSRIVPEVEEEEERDGCRHAG